MKITFEHYTTKVTIEMPDDSDMRSVVDAIKGILLTAGWSMETIENYLSCPKE